MAQGIVGPRSLHRGLGVLLAQDLLLENVRDQRNIQVQARDRIRQITPGAVVDEGKIAVGEESDARLTVAVVRDLLDVPRN